MLQTAASTSPEETKVEEDDIDNVLVLEDNLNFVAVEKLNDSRFILKHASDPQKDKWVEVHHIDDDIVEFKGMPQSLQFDIEA